MPSSTRRVTAADVARLAGCSTAAVSLYLNGKSEGRLTRTWADRIDHAVKTLGYVPNRTARQLSLGASKSIAFVFPGPHYALLGYIVDGVSQSLGPDWDLTFFHSGGTTHPDGYTSSVARVLSSDPGAFIIASPPAAWINAAAAFSVPTVMIDGPRAPDNVSSVEFDFDAGIRQMAQDLAARGHRTAGYVFYDAESASLAVRRSIVEEHLAAVGIQLSNRDLRLSNAEVAVAGDAFAQLWPHWATERVTAVVCADDRHAYGVLSGARGLGLRIPHDVSVVGFNDLEPAGLLSPALSTVALPAQRIGEMAGQLLLEHADQGRVGRHTVMSLYRSRESVGAARPS